MKKTFFILSLFLLFASISVMTSDAATSAPTDAPSASPSGTQNAELMNKIDQQLNNLKERIASRVAELNLVEKRGIIGSVIDASGTQIKVTDIHGDIRFIDVDELTKFSSSDSKNFGISDLTKGMEIGVLGNYNKDSKRILARFVDAVTFPQVITGTVASIDTKNYQFTITKADGKEQLIDNEVFTKTSSYTNANGTVRAGFSKIDTDEHVYIVGFADKKNASMIVASRIILLPDLSPSASQTTPTPTTAKKK